MPMQPHHHRAAAVAAVSAALALAYAARRWAKARRRAARLATSSVLDLIGGTPLVRLRTLSDATGCTILGKAEFLNPGGSSKDRVALGIVREAEASGALRPGGTLVEATAGSTGVSLAIVARACGYGCLLVCADDVSPEKRRTIRALGASLEVVKPASIANGEHAVNVARRRAAEIEATSRGGGGGGSGGGGGGGGGAHFCDQFDNLANMRAHEQTGAEIWEQTGGQIDAFVMGAGTGGTLAGVSRVLKRRNPSVRVYLADPPGSALYHRVRHGVLYAPEQQERTARRHRYDTVMEGVGVDRVTANFSRAHVDDALRVADEEAIAMARRLLAEEGLFVGGSSGMNCVAAERVARQLGPGHTIVTLLCDGGGRYLSSVHAVGDEDGGS